MKPELVEMSRWRCLHVGANREDSMSFTSLARVLQIQSQGTVSTAGNFQGGGPDDSGYHEEYISHIIEKKKRFFGRVFLYSKWGGVRVGRILSGNRSLISWKI